VFDPPPARRSLAPADVVRLLIGLALIVVGAVVANLAQSSVRGVEDDLLRVVDRLPDRIETVGVGIARFATGVIPTVTLVVLLVRRHLRVAGVLLLTGVLANLAMQLAEAFVLDRDLATALDDLRAGNDSVASSQYPSSIVVATSVAIVTVAAPWLSLRWKRTLWWGVAVLCVLRIIAVAQPAFDLVVALGVGTTVGAAMLLVFGSPTRIPRPEELLAALWHLGHAPRTLVAPVPRGTALRYRFANGDGEDLDVVLRTPEERDAELLSRWYRSVRFRSSEVGVPFATLKRRIEHEVLLLTLAAQAGVRAVQVREIGTTDGGSAFYVAKRLDTRPAEPDDLGRPGFLDDLWGQVAALHRAGLAHRSLALEAISVGTDDEAWLRSFDGAQTAATARERARDVAALLTETAAVVGPDDAVAAAVAALGTEAVADSLRMLQPLALTPTTRGRAGEKDDLLGRIRRAAMDRTGAPDIELEELERVKPRTVVIVGATGLAFYSLLPQLANLQDTAEAFQDAQLGWIAGALVASAVTYLAAATAFQGAVADPLPFLPNLRAQVASSFAALVGPSGSGGFALRARFLERLGVRPAEAGASVAGSTNGGVMVHLALMVGFFVWVGSSAFDGFSLPDSDTLLLVVAIVLAVAGGLAMVGAVRRKVLNPVWTSVRTGLSQIGRVFRNPGRVVALFGGSAALSLAYVIAVACCVEAFGGGLTVPQVAAAYLGAVALATFAPTPGGLGALESAMIAGMTGFGLADGVAVSATLTFRLATFWLPLLPGWVALGAMQRRDEL
jgi:uncharacterized membrane protein YbhN (UPF0104 family)